MQGAQHRSVAANADNWHGATTGDKVVTRSTRVADTSTKAANDFFH
jgi:hypothetical protein